jgi:hypothetical protein
MLGPFRIRNLRRPSPAFCGPLNSPSSLAAKDAVVSVSGDEYDRNIEAHPESKLKYVDQDDKEVITVSIWPTFHMACPRRPVLTPP